LPTEIGFKRLGLVIGIAVALGLGAVAASSLLISVDAARDAVTAQIRAATGLDPRVRGAVAISIFPPDTVSLGDVVLGDDRNQPVLATQVLTARLRLLPLLVGRIEIADIVLVRPHIALAFARGSGRSNWSSLVDALATALKPGTQRATLSISEIRINDGTIIIDDPVRDIRETLRHVEMSLAWPSITSTFGATGQFAWRNEVVEAGLNVSDFYAALTGEPSGLKFRLASTPLKVAFDGALSSKSPAKIDGTLAADAGRLRDVLRWLGKSPPVEGGFNRFALKAQVNAVAGAVALSAVNLELDGNITEGVLSYTAGERNNLKGTLAAETLDLTPYAATFHFLTANAREWNTAQMPLDDIAAVDLDLRLSAAQVTINGTKIGRTAAAANLKDGRLNLTIGEAQAFGGLVTGSLAIAKDAGAGTTEFKSQMQFTGVDLESCLGQLFGLRRIDGKGNLAFALDATGDSVDAITRTVGGTATLTAADGALMGFNVEQLLRRLERRPLSGGSDFRSGRTPFSKLNVALKIVDGLATIDDVHMDGSAVRLALVGTSSIPTRDLDLRGTAALVAAANENAFELPFVVHGPWDDPILLPDTEFLIRRSGAGESLRKAVQERSANEAIRKAIERLTGGLPLAPRP
jgi:AsmA protein